MTSRTFRMARPGWYPVYLAISLALVGAMLWLAVQRRQAWRFGPPILILTLIVVHRLQKFEVGPTAITTRAAGREQPVPLDAIVGVFMDGPRVQVNYLKNELVASQVFTPEGTEAFVEAIRGAMTENRAGPVAVPWPALYDRSYKGTPGTRVI